MTTAPGKQLGDRARDGLHRATPHALGRMMLEHDPQFHRIEPSRITELVEAALTDGVSLARETSRRYGDALATLLADSGIEVVESKSDAGYGSHVVYAQYWQKPSRVELFIPALATLERGVTQFGMHSLLGGNSVRDVFLAHELYHHLDLERGTASIAATHRVTLFRIGPYKWTSGIASLAEIAAGAFAQALLDLPHHPKLLDLITLIDRAPQSAERFLERLQTAEGGASMAAHSARPPA